MKINGNKHIFLWLLLALLLTLPLSASAEEAQVCETLEWGAVNPLYPGVFTEADIPALPASPATQGVEPYAYSPAPSQCIDYTELGAEIRQALINREESFSVNITCPASVGDNLTSDTLMGWFYSGLAHTGDPVAGDYLAYQYGAVSAGVDGWHTSTTYYYTFTCSVTYFDTAAQETELEPLVSAAVESALSGLGDAATQNEKISAIYQYVTSHVTYDNVHDSSYLLEYTAYAALKNGTAVCQGYANLLYRMLLTAGVDTRTVGSETMCHAWNVVQAGDNLWYSVDSTWDAGVSPSSYRYYLRGTSYWLSNHTYKNYSEIGTLRPENSANVNTVYDMPAEDYSGALAVKYVTSGAYEVCTVKSGETLTLTENIPGNEYRIVVEAGGTLIIPSSASVVSYGAIVAEGDVVVEGTLTNYNLLQVDDGGSLTVSGTLKNCIGSSSYSYGEIQIYNGTLDVSGTLTSENSIEVLAGSVSVSGTLTNSGEAVFNTPFTLTGKLTNSASGELNSDAGFALTSTGTFNNSGYAFFCGGTQTFTSGTFTNRGCLYVMSSVETDPISHDTLTVALACSTSRCYDKSVIKYDPDSTIQGLAARYIEDEVLEAAWHDASVCLEAVRRGSAITDDTLGRIEDVTASDLSAYALSQSGALPEGVEYRGMTLALDADDWTVTARLVFLLSYGTEDAVFTLDGSAVTPEEQDVYSVVVLPACEAAELGTEHTLTVSCGGTACTLSFSPLSYAVTAYAAGGDLLRMAQALYCLEACA